jgi:anti-sigma factor RsiW
MAERQTHPESGNVVRLLPRPCRDLQVDLALHAVGDLNGDALARLEHHLAACSACRREVSALRELVQELANEQPPQRSEQEWQLLAAQIAQATDGVAQQQPVRRLWRWVGVAAGLAAAAGLALALLPARKSAGELPVMAAELEWLQAPAVPVPHVDEDLVNDADPLEAVDDLDDDELELVDSILSEGGA